MTSGHIQIQMKMVNPNQEPQASTKAQNEDINDMDFFATSKPRKRANILQMGVSKTNDHIQIKIKIPHLHQELPVSKMRT